MSIWGKLIGGAAGLALGGPIGAILGAAAGHGVDKVSNYKTSDEASNYNKAEKEQIFASSVIALVAKLSKVDGRVSKEEILAFKRIFEFSQEDENAIKQIFDASKNDTSNYKNIAEQFFSVFKNDRNMLTELLNSLFAIAYADGKFHEKEKEMLFEVANIFQFSVSEIESINNLHTPQNFENTDLNDRFYKILGASSSASMEDITKKYKNLIKEYHPDRLQGLGLPSDFIELANKKLTKINEAYNAIKNEKKFNNN